MDRHTTTRRLLGLAALRRVSTAKLTRRELLKTIAIVIGAAILGLAGNLGMAHAGGTAIHIHGTVSNPDLGLAVAINIDVAGPHDDLSGAGWDLPGVPLSFPGACYYIQAGSVHGHSVHLEGNILLANDPANVGVPVITDANLSTGAITWQFGPFVFQGVGTVTRK